MKRLSSLNSTPDIISLQKWWEELGKMINNTFIGFHCEMCPLITVALSKPQCAISAIT